MQQMSTLILITVFHVMSEALSLKLVKMAAFLFNDISSSLFTVVLSRTVEYLICQFPASFFMKIRGTLKSIR